MAVTPLDVTPGSATANAYVTLAVADQYHEDRPAVGTTWSSATTDNKNRAILWATTLMDSLWEWAATPTFTTQVLQWPRNGLMNALGTVSLDNATIPEEIQEATAEYARQLLVGDLAGNSDVETQGITSLRAGSVALTFKESVSAKPVPDTVVYLIPREWGYPISRNRGVRRLARA